MTPAEIERFFKALSKECEVPVRVILTGAAAGALMGNVRPSRDIDFCIELRSRGSKAWAKIEQGLDRAVKLTGIPVNYAQDIDRWGQISLLDYRKQTLPYRRFGKVEVRLLDPRYWAIGKISRYLNPDILDLVAVLSKRRVSPDPLVKVWARALKKSPPSLARFQFKQHAEHFLKTYGRRIWGKGFDPSPTIQSFHRSVSRS